MMNRKWPRGEEAVAWRRRQMRQQATAQAGQCGHHDVEAPQCHVQ